MIKNQKLLKNRNGFSTLELLLAMALLALAFSAVVPVVFSAEALSQDSQNTSQASAKANKILQQAQNLSRSDYASVKKFNSTDAIYNQQLELPESFSARCQELATAAVSWTGEYNRPQITSFGTLLPNTQDMEALGGNCDFQPPNGRWDSPGILNNVDGVPTGTVPTAIDVYNKIVFLAALGTSSLPDLFIFNSQSTSTGGASLKYTLDTSASGINALQVALYPDKNFYIFASNNKSATSTADKQLYQLQIIRLPENLSAPPQLISQTSLPGVVGGCPYSCPQGRSLYYYDNHLYIGTHRLLAGGAYEFHIYDVSDPQNPVWKGKITTVDNNVNAITVSQQTIDGAVHIFAFLATSYNNGVVKVVDVTNPAAPVLINSAMTNLPGSEDAYSLYLKNNFLFVGRAKPTGNDENFFVLDISQPLSGYPLPLVGQAKITADIVGLQVSGDFAFLATSATAGFKIINIDDPENPKIMATPNLIQKTVGVKYENNLVYMSSQSATGLKIFNSN